MRPKTTEINVSGRAPHAVQLHAEEFMTCTTCEQQPWFSFFFDGTGNNRKLDEPKRKLSNVARLYEGHGEERPLVKRFYYAGVGTPLDASDPGWWEKIRDSEALGGGSGLGSDARLVKAETDFRQALQANHKVSRIDVAVFGFSRGATLARAFVNRLLKKCEMKDGVPYWPCPMALNGESSPLHFRFLGLLRTIATADGEREMNKPLSDEEAAYWDAWLNPPTLSPELERFFDQYVHDSRAGFLCIDSSGYFRPRRLIEPSGTPRTVAQSPETLPAVPAAGVRPASTAPFSLS